MTAHSLSHHFLTEACNEPHASDKRLVDLCASLTDDQLDTPLQLQAIWGERAHA